MVFCFLCILSSLLINLSQAAAQSFPEPIDIVYSWVDGNDPEWLAIRAMYQGNIPISTTQTQDANTLNRFSDHEELRYSLRSILKYAPFFNHIYIVTMNQRPKWLAEHPQITIVDHREIFLNPGDLPIFNSHAIESNLHRIPHLHEHFIYFNDDVLLGQPVTPFDFFTLDGKVKVLFEPAFSPTGPPNENETTYRSSWRNTNALLDQYYVQERRFRLKHTPFALMKSYMEATEEEFPAVFTWNSASKFRSRQDYNIVNGFVQYHWLYHGKVVEGDLSNLMVSVRSDEWIRRTKRAFDKLKMMRPHTFCLQDNMIGESEQTKKLLHQLLESWYPIPAPWENDH